MPIVKTILTLFFVSNAFTNAYLDEFQEFQAKYNKKYDNIEEFNYRYVIFSENMDKINTHDAETAGYKIGINRFADLPPYEFDNYYKGYQNFGDADYNYEQQESCICASDLPESVDWRDASPPVLTDVKDQAQCGSCWAFSAVEAVESAVAISSGNLYVLSEQEVVDCDASSSGCGGGWMDNAFKFIIDNGICLEKDYPYVAIDESCEESNCKPVVEISGYKDIEPKNEKALMKAESQQPVSIAVDASAFQLYESGVIKTDCGAMIDHGVVAIGYGTDLDGTDYWLIRNSWGESWGMKGYVKVARGTGDNDGYGTCGVLYEPSYPVV